MSPLATSPFYNYSSYRFPRLAHPLSPPDTDSELGATLQPTSVSASNLVELGVEFDQTASQLSQQTESSAAGFKRVSTLAYNKSNLHERQERSNLRTQSLVVIVPPENLSREHGQLGHTLSSGPRHRLSQGILMPLCSTMYGQLMAIVKEYNFPSTVGICLYLHVSDSGITVTPRISDESWQLLWGHILHGSTPALGAHGLPIVGRVEFDIDLSKARWYGSWIAASNRDSAEHVFLFRSLSTSHWRSDSKTSSPADQIEDEHQESPLSMSQTQMPISNVRRGPRKLSLVDRFDSFSIPSAPRPASQTDTLPIECLEVQIIPSLSPIMQADEPQTAKQGLEKKVNSWRASVSLVPNTLPSTSETTVEVGEVPMGVLLDNFSDAEDATSELNLDDFTWSVSSAGPPSNDLDSPLSSGRLSSIHIDRRLQESVYLTPLGGYLGPSNYLGDRADSSRPATPSTEITKSSYPPTPSTPPFVHRFHGGERACELYDHELYDHELYDHEHIGRHDTSDGTPWTHVWPYRYIQSHECEIPRLSAHTYGSKSACSYPYLNIYPSVYPYFDLYQAVSVVKVECLPSKCLTTRLQATYPFFDIYPTSYPHINIYFTASSMTGGAIEMPAVSQTTFLRLPLITQISIV